MTSRRGYAILRLNRIKYTEDGIEGLNKVQIGLGMVDRADHGEFTSFLLVHETDISLGDRLSMGDGFV
jgi:hypothetical protein